ncbi:hypothetical protein PanWU01x14_077100 [Parasponia andersonii]|uniref:Uncharacterized protein n=1 Tax=Parasponia andersonii TaxID=3476 RepID=A0A2P5DCL7_PARAD|nr:hypothetical protein PanWU01x14_077100 [Parasponia andersonii]
MVGCGENDRAMSAASSSISLSTSNVSRDLKLTDREEPEVLITKVRHPVPIDLDLLEAEANHDASKRVCHFSKCNKESSLKPSPTSP